MKVLILAPSGFGKSTSILKVPRYGLEGLNPKETYVISVTSKPLPAAGSSKLYPILPGFSLKTQMTNLKDYRRIVLNGGAIANPGLAAHAITLLSGVKSIRNIVLDDMNYIMQDYYMAKAMAQGWDAPKKIGYDMGKIFEAMELIGEDKNFIALAHSESYQIDNTGRIGFRMKTTGKMVNEYITPEGKFEIVLFGHSQYNEVTRKSEKSFVTNDDGMYTTAKSPIGLFGKLYIPNDLGYIVRRGKEYYEDGIEEEPQEIETNEEVSQVSADSVLDINEPKEEVVEETTVTEEQQTETDKDQ